MELTLKEKSLEREGDTAVIELKTKIAEQLDERVLTALRAASDKKAQNSVVIDLQEIASFTDYFIITAGSNTRQVQAIADGVEEDLKKYNQTRPKRIEGYNSAEWILLDYGDFVVHVFEQKMREFYDLERLWRDARRVTLPEEL